uniref:Uncharacterized protein n=1 Tax=Ditylenchus dipsaci TaxID=166011 RepID=A0A915EMB3_9BILA
MLSTDSVHIITHMAMGAVEFILTGIVNLCDVRNSQLVTDQMLFVYINLCPKNSRSWLHAKRNERFTPSL